MKNIKLEESPGLTPPLKFDLEDQEIWNEEYNKLSSEKKTLLETQEQTRLIRRISKNVLFFFWLTIISLVLYLIVVVSIFDYL
jgi:hypothetical protein